MGATEYRVIPIDLYDAIYRDPMFAIEILLSLKMNLQKSYAVHLLGHPVKPLGTGSSSYE